MGDRGAEEKGLVAYQADSGELAWSAPTGPISYTTAQPITVDGQSQVLLLADTGVVSVDPQSGEQLWNYEAPGHSIWRVAQPRQLDGAKYSSVRKTSGCGCSTSRATRAAGK